MQQQKEPAQSVKHIKQQWQSNMTSVMRRATLLIRTGTFVQSFYTKAKDNECQALTTNELK